MSKNNNLVVAIDIGSYKIRTVVALAEEEREFPHILWIWTSFSNGIRKWNVVSIKDLIADINMSIEEAETISWMPIQSVYISMCNNQISSVSSKWIVAISNKEIADEDVQRALEASQAISLPQNKYILEVIPKLYRIDNHSEVTNPIWMSGTRLEVETQIILTSEQSLRNLEKSVNQVWIEVLKVIPWTLASCEAVLTRRQKELWVVCIDIWASSTGFSVYEESVLLYTGNIPVWWESVTNDIAIGLRTSIETAEKIKIEYWTINRDSISEREQIDLSVISTIDTEKISKKELANIMRARYEEIFYMVKNELKLLKRDWMLPAWVILTWWWCKSPWVVDICKELLSLPVQIWFPQEITSVVDKIEDPEYATTIWLIKYWSNHAWQEPNFSFNLLGTFDWISKWLKNLLPS